MGCARYYPSAPTDLLSILSTLLLRQQADLYGVRDWVSLFSGFWLGAAISRLQQETGGLEEAGVGLGTG